MMKSILVSSLAALILFGGQAHAVNACDKASTVRAAFEPRLVHEQARAKRVGDMVWSSSVRSGFERIARTNQDCKALFAEYHSYMDGVIARNDALEKTAGSGGIFRKW